MAQAIASIKRLAVGGADDEWTMSAKSAAFLWLIIFILCPPLFGIHLLIAAVGRLRSDQVGRWRGSVVLHTFERSPNR
jgi:hypothetical protein